MSSFFLAMSVYPEVQAQAQAEMDRVVGQGRLPSWDDHDSLPYLEALVKEVLRWNPVGPLGSCGILIGAGSLTSQTGVPHRSTQEQIFEGQRIPKGTVFIANIWFAIIALTGCPTLIMTEIFLGVFCTMRILIQTHANSTLPDILVIKLPG
jgi:hypothetical protein